MNRPVTEWLVAELRSGGRDSREILVVAGERGFTPHQVRYAREILGVTISRRGNRRSMRSVWALPNPETRCESKPDSKADGDIPLNGSPADADCSRSARARAREGPVRTEVRTVSAQVSAQVPDRQTVEGDGTSDRPEPTTTRVRANISPFTDGEQRRIERRIVHFRAKGIPQDEAAELARHLVLERDRVNELRDSGSCAECESLGGGSCQAEKEGAGVAPRPIQEVWNCWCARRPMP